MTQAMRARLTGRAARFVQVLQDFGHLDPDGVDRLLVLLAETYGGKGEVLVDVGLVRPVVAAMLFEGDPEAEDGNGVLAEDWPLLFH